VAHPAFSSHASGCRVVGHRIWRRRAWTRGALQRLDPRELADIGRTEAERRSECVKWENRAMCERINSAFGEDGLAHCEADGLWFVSQNPNKWVKS
jgi:uncharacterized protein YjiS (DUF1127 family)